MPRSDVFSLAATLFHLLTGRPPFDATSLPNSVVEARRGIQPLYAHLGHIAVFQADVLLGGLNPQSRRRPDLNEFLQELVRVTDSLKPASEGASNPARMLAWRPERYHSEMPTADSTTYDGPLRPRTEPLLDPLYCSAFAPPIVYPRKRFMVQVLAHLAEQSELAVILAKQADPDAELRIRKGLEVDVELGETLRFDLSIPEFDVIKPSQTLIWRGMVEPVQFEVRVPDAAPKGNVIATVTVLQKNVPIGHLKFIIRVVPESWGAMERQPLVDASQRYRKAFISYASADRNEVLKRVQMLQRVGIDFFQDLLHLKPGELWERSLFHHIDECDVFFLFWSGAAERSPWVREEVRYAMRRKGGDDLASPRIIPVALETPITPPEELRHIHFGDPLIYLTGN